MTTIFQNQSTNNYQHSALLPLGLLLGSYYPSFAVSDAFIHSFSNTSFTGNPSHRTHRTGPLKATQKKLGHIFCNSDQQWFYKKKKDDIYRLPAPIIPIMYMSVEGLLIRTNTKWLNSSCWRDLGFKIHLCVYCWLLLSSLLTLTLTARKSKFKFDQWGRGLGWTELDWASGNHHGGLW